MSALPIEHDDIRTDAREWALALLRNRAGVIRSLTPEQLRNIGNMGTAEQIGLPGSRAADE
jgi:hypothetical protein